MQSLTKNEIKEVGGGYYLITINDIKDNKVAADGKPFVQFSDKNTDEDDAMIYNLLVTAGIFKAVNTHCAGKCKVVVKEQIGG